MTVTLTPPVRFWACPSCPVQDRTQQAAPHTKFHQCAALNGIEVPLQEVKSLDQKVDAHYVLVEREDYMGNDIAGRIAAIRTERGDGSNDCTVLAPCAVGKVN